jgi:hypothetical protein
MELSRLPLLCLLLLLAVLVVAATDVSVAPGPSPDCKRRCGDIEVPYPFGLERQCAIHRGFHLHCNTTDQGVTKLFQGTVEVTKISVPDNKAWEKNYISRQCYNGSTNQVIYNSAWINNTVTPFALSAEDNKIVVLGCKSVGYMVSDIVSLRFDICSILL